MATKPVILVIPFPAGGVTDVVGRAVAAKLTDSRGLVYRYRSTDGSDGLEGDEGTFLLCTFWLAQAYALTGRVERARELGAAYEREVVHRDDLVLL